MRILFLNTWHAKLQEPLSEFITARSESIDVFCFQETDRARPLLRSLLPGFQEISADKVLANGDDFSQAIYIRSDISVTNSEVLLQDAPDTGLALQVSLERDQTKLSVCNVHGISFHKVDDKLDTPGRLAQSRTIMDYYKNSEIPVIIGGDFNMLPVARSIQMFSDAGYQNLITRYKIPTTRNRYAWERYPDTPQNFADFLFTGRGVQIDSFKVAPELVSDHQPLILDVSIPAPVGASKA